MTKPQTLDPDIAGVTVSFMLISKLIIFSHQVNQASINLLVWSSVFLIVIIHQLDDHKKKLDNFLTRRSSVTFRPLLLLGYLKFWRSRMALLQLCWAGLFLSLLSNVHGKPTIISTVLVWLSFLGFVASIFYYVILLLEARLKSDLGGYSEFAR